MLVQGRLLLNKCIDVGDGDQELYGPVGHCLGNSKLVQIKRIVVIDGAPE